jgi:hypothetical protein
MRRSLSLSCNMKATDKISTQISTHSFIIRVDSSHIMINRSMSSYNPGVKLPESSKSSTSMNSSKSLISRPIGSSMNSNINLSQYMIKRTVANFSNLKPVPEHAATKVYSNINEMIEFSTEVFANNKAFGTYFNDPADPLGKHYDYISYKEFGEEIQKFRQVLQRYNIEKNSKVAVISNNRLEWASQPALLSISDHLISFPMFLGDRIVRND